MRKAAFGVMQPGKFHAATVYMYCTLLGLEVGLEVAF